MGLLLLLFATIGLHSPVWVIILLVFSCGACTSLRFTSISTLTYADIPEDAASMAGSIASTALRISISLGVASAGLAAVFFLPVGQGSNLVAMIRGTHQSFIALGVFTLIPKIAFAKLTNTHGDNVTRQKVIRSA